MLPAGAARFCQEHHQQSVKEFQKFEGECKEEPAAQRAPFKFCPKRNVLAQVPSAR